MIELGRNPNIELLIKPNPPQAVQLMEVGEEEETIKEEEEAEVILMVEEVHNKTGKTILTI